MHQSVERAAGMPGSLNRRHATSRAERLLQSGAIVLADNIPRNEPSGFI